MSGRRIVTHTPGGKLVTHGGTGSTYRNHGCRCEECTAAHVACISRRRAVRVTEGSPLGVTHGASTYDTWGCRCTVCSEGHAEAMRHQHEKRLAAPERIPHGTPSGRKNWGCRCDACSDAASRHNRAYYLLRKARAARAAP